MGCARVAGHAPTELSSVAGGELEGERSQVTCGTAALFTAFVPPNVYVWDHVCTVICTHCLIFQFVFGPLLKVLNESFIYARYELVRASVYSMYMNTTCVSLYREPNAPHSVCPPVAASLTKFLQRLVTELPMDLKGLF